MEKADNVDNAGVEMKQAEKDSDRGGKREKERGGGMYYGLEWVGMRSAAGRSPVEQESRRLG